MQWIRFTIETTTEACDSVCGVLYGLGYDSVEIEDGTPVHDPIQGRDYEELMPDGYEDDGSARVHFYVEDGADLNAITTEVEAAIGELKDNGVNVGEATVKSSVTKDEDWANNWKEYFHSFSVGDIYIHPSWEEPGAEAEGKTVVQIDPGVSFGTGHHESTQLIIKQMSKYLKPGNSVLDVGCGSGILSVIAQKMGAGFITGIDIDADCVASSYSNMKRNDVGRFFGEFMVGDLSVDATLGGRIPESGYDIIFANLLADIIMSMPEALFRALKPGGVLITSGIIDFKTDEVKECLKDHGFALVDVSEQGEWRSITATKEI